MKRVLVVAMVVFVLALQVSTVSAGGGIRVDPGGAVSLSAVNWTASDAGVAADPGTDGSVTVLGGKPTPKLIFSVEPAGDTVTLDTITPDPTIGK